MDAQRGFELFSHPYLWNYHKFMDVSNFMLDSARLELALNNKQLRERKRKAAQSCFYAISLPPRPAGAGQKANLCKAAEC